MKDNFQWISDGVDMPALNLQEIEKWISRVA